MSLADLAGILDRASVHGAKVVVTGDPTQLQAIENGGGMAMLDPDGNLIKLTV